MIRNKGRFSIKSIIFNICVLILGACYLFPIYIILVNSFKTRSELYDNMLALPAQFSLKFYEKAMTKMNFVRAFCNSFPLLLHYHPLLLYRHQLCKQADTVFAHFLFEDAQSMDTIRKSFE